MAQETYNGKKEQVSRIYGSLRFFMGENKVYKRGEILYVSTRNNGDCDLVLQADGERNFNKLYTDYVNGKGNKDIDDKSVGLEDLSEEVQASLHKADTALQEHQDLSGKQDVIEDLNTIRSGAEAGSSAYQKPQAGIPLNDLDPDVQANIGTPASVASVEDMRKIVTEYNN